MHPCTCRFLSPCSLAHVELNAIDLAWDTVVRFSRYGLPPAFYADFARCAGRPCWLLVPVLQAGRAPTERAWVPLLVL